LCGGGEEEFVICAAWTSQPEPSQSEDAFELGKEHFNFLSELHRDVELTGLGAFAGDLAGVFVFCAGDLVASALWQYLASDGQIRQTPFRARYRAVPFPVGPQFGSE